MEPGEAAHRSRPRKGVWAEERGLTLLGPQIHPDSGQSSPRPRFELRQIVECLFRKGDSGEGEAPAEPVSAVGAAREERLPPASGDELVGRPPAARRHATMTVRIKLVVSVWPSVDDN
jgi:hypothetical protein